MNLMGNYFAIAITAFLSGAVIGALLYRLFQKDAGRSRRVEQQMDDLQQKHTHYQAQVSEHFLQTAHLINRLNEDYREIHSHLAQGANELCNEDGANDLLSLSAEPLFSENKEEHDIQADAEIESEAKANDSFEPPRDYAPKAGEDKGTLSEDFGLQDKKEGITP
jgi:uncharacterized protein